MAAGDLLRKKRRDLKVDPRLLAMPLSTKFKDTPEARRARRGETPPSLSVRNKPRSQVERAVQDIFGLEPGIERPGLLPLRRNPENGQIELTAPQVLYDAARAFVAPGVALSGAPMDLQGEAQNFALNFTGAGIPRALAARPLESGVVELGMSGGRRTEPSLAENEALQLYHGAKGRVEGPLRSSSTGEFGPGTYLTTSPTEAKAYAGSGPEAQLLRVNARIKNPFVVKSDPQEFWDAFGGTTDEDAVKRAIEAGHDAVAFQRPVSYWDDNLKRTVDTDEMQTHYNVFDPTTLTYSADPAFAVQSVPASPRAEASLAAREGEKVAKPTHTFVRTEVPEVAPLPGKGGKSRRKTTAAQVRDEAAARARAEAQARLAVTDPVERRAIRDEYTIGPLAVDPDPALQRFSLRPGSQQSVTSQAMELGVPVEGATPFFTQHPAGYSTSWGSAAPTPMTVTGTYRNRTPEPDVPMLNEGDIPIGAGLFRALGDATMANKDVLSVNGVNLVNPVSTLGGARYGYQEAAVGNPLVWASDASVEENDARMIRDWQNKNPGMPVIGMHVNMGSSGSDFSHQTGNILANLIPNLGLSGDKLRLIDDYIRSGKEGLADFAGFAEDPALGLFDILTRPGGDRKLVTKRLSDVTKEAQMAGVPGHLGALARLAVAEPGLRLAPQGSTGFSVFQIDPENFLRVDPSLLSGAKRRLFEGTNEYANVLGEPVKFMRPDYNAGFSGRNLGQMQSLIPAEIPFGPVFARAKEITKTGAPTTTTMKFKSFATDPNSIVTYTPEIQDALGQYLYDVSKYKRLGWSRGGLAELADKYAA